MILVGNNCLNHLQLHDNGDSQEDGEMDNVGVN